MENDSAQWNNWNTSVTSTRPGSSAKVTDKVSGEAQIKQEVKLYPVVSPSRKIEEETPLSVS